MIVSGGLYAGLLIFEGGLCSGFYGITLKTVPKTD